MQRIVTAKWGSYGESEVEEEHEGGFMLWGDVDMVDFLKVTKR